MEHLVLVGVLLLCVAAPLLLVERGWRARLWKRQEEQNRNRVEALEDASAGLSAGLENARKRQRELEALVLYLSERLQSKELTPKDRQLLNDIYHEYGTETHELFFGERPRSVS